MFVFSSRRRHTRCALGTRIQTCALPIYTVEYLLPILRAQTANPRWVGEATGDTLEFSYTQRGIKHTISVSDAVTSKSVTNNRSAERRVGKEGVSTCIYLWSPDT